MNDMNALHHPGEIGDVSDTKNANVWPEILVVFAPLLIVGGIGERLGDGTVMGSVLITLAYVMSLALATFALKRRGRGWREIGLAKPESWRKTAVLAIGAMVGAILANLALQGIVQALPGVEMAPADKSSFDPLAGNLPLLLLYLAAAWTSIGFGEEMLFRAFLIDSFARLFHRTSARWTFALIGSSLAFGLAHLSWGFTGVVETTIMGLLLGFVYLRAGRNLWVTIVAHGLMNTLGFLLIYSGAA